MMQHVRTKHGEQTERNLYVAIRDGMAYAAMVGIGEAYLSAFAVYLHASALQIGILASLPPLFGALCQVFSLRLLELIKSRRWLVVAGARLQAFSFIPILLIPLLFGTGPVAATVLIMLVLVYHGALGITVPVWNSLIGDLVPSALRGQYFGRRNQFAGMCTLGGMLLAGGLLHWFTESGLTAWGYALIFIIAGCCRYRSSIWLGRYEDPDYRVLPESYFSLVQFVARTPYSNFARFVFFVSSMMLATNIAAPYFAIYMLRDLKFTYFEYMIATSVVAITQILTLQHWGRLVDRFGSKNILTFCGYGAALIPFFWLISPRLPFIVGIQLYSGFVWAGFNLATATFMFDAVTPQKRARCAAYQAMVQGIFVLIGTLIGAHLLDSLPATFSLFGLEWIPGSPVLALFLVSGIFRLAVVKVFLNRFHEVREVEATKPMKLIFHMLSGIAESAGNIDLIAPATEPPKRGQARSYQSDGPPTETQLPQATTTPPNPKQIH